MVRRVRLAHTCDRPGVIRGCWNLHYAFLVDLSSSRVFFGVDWWFFLILTQRMTTVWSRLLLWCRVPPITKRTRKRRPPERWERDPVYPEQNPVLVIATQPCTWPQRHAKYTHFHTLPNTHTWTCANHTHMHTYIPGTTALGKSINKHFKAFC